MRTDHTELVPGRCGTHSGWARHQRASEKPCDACAAAKSAYDKRRLATHSAKKRKAQQYARAQGRAERRLAGLYPEVYRALYEEAKREIIAEDLLKQTEKETTDDKRPNH